MFSAYIFFLSVYCGSEIEYNGYRNLFLLLRIRFVFAINEKERNEKKNLYNIHTDKIKQRINGSAVAAVAVASDTVNITEQYI